MIDPERMSHLRGLARTLGLPDTPQLIRRMIRDPSNESRKRIEAAYGDVFPDPHVNRRWFDWARPYFRYDARAPRPERPVVGILHTVFFKTGGTETWARHFLRCMGSKFELAGLAFVGGDMPTDIEQPVGKGEEALMALSSVCDVLITWGLPAWQMQEVRTYAKPGCKIIQVHHGDRHSDWSEGIIRHSYQRGDTVVCVNREQSELFSGKYRTVWIPNAVDRTRLADERPKGGPPTVLWMHRYSLEKNPVLAVRACKLCPKDWRFVFAGNPVVTYEEAVREAGNDKRFTFLDQGDPKELLSRAHVFLSTTNIEGFGYSVAEAAASGLRVVSTPLGIAQDARVCRQAKAQLSYSISRHLMRAMEERAEAARARLYVLANYGEDAWIERWGSLIDTLTNRRSESA